MNSSQAIELLVALVSIVGAGLAMVIVGYLLLHSIRWATGIARLERFYPSNQPPPPNTGMLQIHFLFANGFWFHTGSNECGLFLQDPLFGRNAVLIPWEALGTGEKLGPWYVFHLIRPRKRLLVHKQLVLLKPLVEQTKPESALL
jgi:hypothetical protein